MKINNIYKLTIVLFFIFVLILPAFAEEKWETKPVISHIYELSKEKLLLEWEGNASLYQVYVDGKKAVSVNLNNAVIDCKSGAHQITVMPVAVKTKEGDNKPFSFDVEISGLSEILQMLKIPALNLGDIRLGLDIDLAKLGIEPKDLVTGDPSDTVKINYTPNSVSDSTPEILSAYTGFDERIVLTFTDKYDSNIYRIYIKSGKDVVFAEFDPSAEDAASLISKDRSRVTVILDPDFLEKHECMIPELDQKYSFSVKLQKWPVDFIDGTKETEILLESKESKWFDYTPYAAWKNAPVITYASQTADGQVTLKWDHDDNGLGCQYRVIKHDSIMGVKRNVEEIAVTAERQLMIEDLMNGKYNYAVIPVYNGEEGFSSESVVTEVNNNWVAAPSVKCTQGEGDQVILTWNSPEGIESYHVTVSVGSGSLLRFVKLDYRKYEEFDIPAVTGGMEYTYEFDRSIGTESGISLKFDIYGLRHTADGSEQKSAATTTAFSIEY